ncbi:hypothetical protein CANCADRAFT_148671 [Tortispora caseinolytica NRRL Y-17796]|uniref:Inositol-1-monophosphatase n=1 Tax=Tortispora caseinolytica NRRL Y-17796 TaxID=767744 RepID=A0A1E4T9E6_9ASCO|nr:hypothetical protein CANCADRAFT_148671 [Tortispora caseinolytica NRRL Y-17796]
MDLEEIRDFLVQLARTAGEMIREKTGKVTWDDKMNSVDLVTETDAAVERMVKEQLASKYPDFKFMGEETAHGVLTADPTFIVDPIDGTTNFIHRFPSSCISLGFAVDKVPVVGVVYNPLLDHMYQGVQGKGAYFNGQKLPLKPPSELSLGTALIAIEWGSERSGPNYTCKTQTFANLAASDGGMVHGFRSMGSAALNLCSVAAGTLDAYWEGGCWAWDVCAGWAILAETGGAVVHGNPGTDKAAVDSRVYLAVRAGSNQQKFIADFKSHIKGSLSY